MYGSLTEFIALCCTISPSLKILLTKLCSKRLERKLRRHQVDAPFRDVRCCRVRSSDLNIRMVSAILSNMPRLSTELTGSGPFSVYFTIGAEWNVRQWSGASQNYHFFIHSTILILGSVMVSTISWSTSCSIMEEVAFRAKCQDSLDPCNFANIDLFELCSRLWIQG